MTTVTIGGKPVRLGSPDAKGGEAEIFFIGDRAIKVYKAPDHPDFGMDPDGSMAASQRLLIHQDKLPSFPGNMPAGVVRPEDLVYRGREIVGYVMRKIKDSEPIYMLGQADFRNESGVENSQVTGVLAQLRDTVSAIHAIRAVIGDFNDLNVMVDMRRFEPHIIDADSFQYGKWACTTYTQKFLDPLLAKPGEMTLSRPYVPGSDWYAFCIMLMQSLLFVGPHGGVYRPPKGKQRVSIEDRALQRITVFDRNVVYPKHATHWSVLPDGLLHHLQGVFVSDRRDEFPAALVRDMEWQKCPDCGIVHARAACPVCRHAPEAAKKAVVQITGKVKATRVFRTSGVIVHSTVQGDQPKWVYHEAGKYRREDGVTTVMESQDVLPGLRFRVIGSKTVFGSSSIGLDGTSYPVEKWGNLPVFDTNSQAAYWVSGNVIMKSEQIAPKRFGQVIPGHTLLWTGEKFGFGFYLAGHYLNAFTFDCSGGHFKDGIAVPPVRGEMIDAAATFSSGLCWFMLTEKLKGLIFNRCCVVSRDGQIVATHDQEAGKEGWLSAIRGGFASGSSLFVPTDDGIVVAETSSGGIAIAREFPDTAPHVTSHSRLLGTSEGLWVVERSTVTKLEMS